MARHLFLCEWLGDFYWTGFEGFRSKLEKGRWVFLFGLCIMCTESRV